jgi:glutamate synthase domain-containing protein 3
MVCLGRTGRNFAAGMSGGFAYVLDEDNRFRRRCNPAMIDLELMDADDDDAQWLQEIINRHHELTGSPRAAEILAGWEDYLSRFVRVFPREYRRVLTERATKALEKKEAAHG